jgi:hypothetical protein
MIDFLEETILSCVAIALCLVICLVGGISICVRQEEC